MSYYDLILHLDSPEPEMLALVLKNAANYLNALPGERFSLVIVANGGGVRLLSNEREDLRARALPVLARGARLKACANALADNSLAKDSIWPECEVVPAGLVEVVRLQREGYAYIKP